MRAKTRSSRPQCLRRSASAGILGFTILLGALVREGGAQALPQDHLECFTLQARGTTWTPNTHAGDQLDVSVPASLTPPFEALGPGVELLTRGRQLPKEICVAVSKDPSRAPTGSPIVDALACYDVKYRRASGAAEASLTDQFGARTVVVRDGRRKLCVPITLP